MGEEQKGRSRSVPALIMHKVGHGIELFEVWVLCIGIFSLAVLLIANVFARTFFQSIYFVEEISEFLVILITFVGLSYAVRKARHIRMGAIFDAMPPRLQKVFIFIICAVSATVMFMMARYSLNYMMVARDMMHRTPALRLPYWLFLVIIPLGFFSAGLQYVRTIIKNVVEKDVWLSPEQQGEYEEETLEVLEESYAGTTSVSQATD